MEEKSETLLIEDYIKLKEYAMALERTRADLWGTNQELREKIATLEKGQEDLQQIHIAVRKFNPILEEEP